MKNSLDRINERLDLLLNKLEKIDKFAGTIGAGTGAGAGVGMMSGSLSTVSTVAQPMSQGGAVMSALKATFGGLATTAIGVSQAMPDLAMTVARRAGFYQAGVASGGIMSLGGIERTTRLGLGQFSTSQGSDAAVAAMLTSRGMNPASQAYRSTITAVGQAARYLNMPNEVAASALENLSAGPTSAMLMRNFGVFTTDPRTGKNLTQGQIFSQMAARFGGAGATTEEVLGSLRSGNLGSNIRNSGLDPAQQALLSQYFIDRSRGIDMDLSNPKAIDEAIKRNQELGISNPMLEQYRQNSLDNRLMERATEPYLRGMEAASDALEVLKTGLEALPDSIYEAKAAFDFFTGDKAGAGSIVALTGAVETLVGIVKLVGAALGIGALAKGGAAIANAIKTGGVGSPSKVAAPSSQVKPGRSAAAMAADNYKPGAGPSGMGNWFKNLGKSLGITAFTSALINSGFEAVDLLQKKDDPQWVAQQRAAMEKTKEDPWKAFTDWAGDPGNWVDALLSFGATGGGGTINPSPNNSFTQSVQMGGGRSSRPSYARRATGGAGTIDPGPQGNNWTGAFGEQRPYGKHNGVDIAMPIGTPLKAVMDGVVTYAGSGSGARSYGIYVKIKHADGYETMYAHLSRAVVKKGDTVVTGNLVAYSGNSGYSTGPHLHFELRKNGTPINPERFVGPQLYGGASATWAKGNDGTAGSSTIDSGMTSGDSAAAAIVDQFYNTDMSGISSNPISAATILESVLSSSSGSLANIPGTSASTNIPDPISGPDTSGMMGAALEELAGNTQEKAVGGGYEPSGLIDVDSQPSIRGGSVKKTKTLSSTGSTHVTIHVNIAQATPEEAKKFAKLVKEQLEEEKSLNNVGSR